jgi:predicted dehydrogenase
VTRRDFVKKGAVGLGAAAAATNINLISRAAYAQGGGTTLGLGIVGSGGRGTGAIFNHLTAAKELGIDVQLRAMGDLAEDRLSGALSNLKQNWGAQVDVPANRQFVGMDAYQGVCAADEVDIVIQTTPPGLRYLTLAEAVKNGKHSFVEKPVCVDSDTYKSVLASGGIADNKDLAIVTGTQYRRETSYADAITQLNEGIIGDVTAAYAYYCAGTLWHRGRGPADAPWSAMEYQMRNWLYFTWLSGDHIVEQHVHNIDVALWAFGDQAPTKAYGNGGRQQRTGEEWGHGNDHFSLQISMPGFGRCINSHCRQIPGCDNYVGEEIIGTNGYARMGGTSTLVDLDGERVAQFSGGRDPYVQEHANLVASFRAGEPLNEAHRIAQTTLTAIIAREAAYSGKNIDYNWALNESTQKLGPGEAPGCYTSGLTQEHIESGDVATPPVYIPGAYQMA